MKKRLLFFLMATTLTIAALWFTACQKDNAETTQPVSTLSADDRSNGNSKVFPPTAHPYGKSYTEWTVDWMKEFMADDCAHNAWLNPQYVLFHQNGPVYFMAGLSTTGASANITVPHGKAILFPLVNFLNDHPCPDPNFQPDPGQSMEDFLKNGTSTFSGVTDFMALVANTSVTIDGSPVSNTANYQFISNLFNFTANEDLANCFDPCINGASQPGVAGGYYIMLKPLSKGTHTVHYHMEIPDWNAVQDGTFNITIP